MIFSFRKKYPVILERDLHDMSKGHIERGVLDILYRLKRNGYDAYLVGGCVRDLLLGRKPKDFDIVTNAHPRQIKRLFSRCFLIGKRFRLAHVYIGTNRFVEVATFRALVDKEQVREQEGVRFAENNVFGTIEEDALRRDFTVNALYFKGSDSSIVDYTGGLVDLKKKVLRSIGKPEVRFREDPVRIIRAARFCAQLGFTPSRSDYKAAVACAPLIKESNANRMLEELYKILRCGASAGTIVNLEKFHILKYWIPEIAPKEYHKSLLARLAVVDRRRSEGEEIPNGVLLTALFYDLFAAALGERTNLHEAFAVVKESFQEMATRLRLPHAEWDRVCSAASRQVILKRAVGGKNWIHFVKKFAANGYFPDALLMLEIISEATGKFGHELHFWKKQRPASSPEAADVATVKRSRKRRPRRRPGKPAAAPAV